MNCRLSGGETGLVAYWPFDESDLSDATGHGHGEAIGGLPGSLTYAALASLPGCAPVGVDEPPAPDATAQPMVIFPQPTRGYNGLRILRPAVDEVMDRAVPDDVVEEVRQIASSVEGVRGIEKCRVRKSGLGLLMDIHVLVDGDSAVRDGHAIGHDVKDRLSVSRLGILDIVVHIEPAEDRTRDS